MHRSYEPAPDLTGFASIGTVPRAYGRGGLLAALTLAMCCLVLPASATALTNYTWTGAAAAGPSAANWSNVTNWGGTAPSGSVGTLTFPILASAACAAVPPTTTCYQSYNDVSGLSVAALSIDDGVDYQIDGNAITLGAGGITASTTATGFQGPQLRLPITLAANQTWSIDGNNNGSQLNLDGDVTGATASLAVTLSHQTFLGLQSDNVEVGPVTVTGGDLSSSGNTAFLNGTLAANHAQLNATDGNPVSVSHAGLFSTDATVGALTLTGASVQVGVPVVPVGMLTVNGALSSDATSVLSMYIAHSGTVAGTDYSQIGATGAVNLGGATLRLSSNGACPALTPGQVDTLVTTTGALSGTFAGIPDGATVPIFCGAPPQPTVRINYTANAVTATILTSPPPVPANISPPTISGTPRRGQTLTESHGSWTNSPTSFAYQWLDCDAAGGNCTPIAGATGQTYTLTAADVGHTIRVAETASNAGGPGSPVNSAATAVVQSLPAPPIAPSNQSAPAITGATTVGRALLASTGTWSGTAPIAYAYQWQRCNPVCASIAGATGPAYTLTVADLGAHVRVVVAASNSAGSGVAASGQVGPVLAAPPTAAQIKALLLKQIAPKGKAARIGAILKAGGYSLSFKALTAGKARVAWYLVPAGAHLAAAKPVLVASGRVTFAAAGTRKLKIKLTTKGKRLLKHAKRLKLTGKGTFTPTGTPVVSAKKRFTLKR